MVIVHCQHGSSASGAFSLVLQVTGTLESDSLMLQPHRCTASLLSQALAEQCSDSKVSYHACSTWISTRQLDVPRKHVTFEVATNTAGPPFTVTRKISAAACVAFFCSRCFILLASTETTQQRCFAPGLPQQEL